jgi:2-C-methyl-D-erythritol 4-phosphate cytidylyltransferase
MATWGVLRLPAGADAAAGAGEGAVAAGVAAHLDGLVAVAADVPVRGVLAALPASVTRIVELDAATATDPEAGRVVAALLAATDDVHPAVVAARPLADALKRVEGDVVVAGLERDGLLTPELPSVLDRAALELVADDEARDGVALLLAAGHPIRVVTPDGTATTVRADGPAR